jgi:tetrahydromethanopterin S-methyltransferase subunit F
MVGRMEGVLIGFIWTVIIVGGALALGAIVQMVKSPYRDR